ncbi:UDP-GlcNAc:betaGal beta-1,3-N-acetylglucosaminyltransferase 8 [Limanda limanda]|uniref:UDP-GlcNAc:betaGal beta-1,3-N-acetylglucosaminyltransferase 8 n=1 Tax=Limanda limanda TaxID=27771 RepID=UPI0029C6BF16|nr:UDP-GlcNAc:betaGal beta-1,3-N-acetylglucosaminyltransferase 8 [Limanda limanda]
MRCIQAFSAVVLLLTLFTIFFSSFHLGTTYSHQDQHLSHQDPLKPLGHQDPLKPLGHQDPLKPLNQQDPLKPLSHQDPLKPLNHQDPLKPLSHQDQPLNQQDPLKPLSHQDQPLNQQDPLKPLNHQDPLKPLSHQDPLKPLNQDPLKPLSLQDPLKPLSHQDQSLNQRDPLKPLSHQDPLKPLNHQDPLKPLSHQDQPLNQQDPLKPLSHQDPLKPLNHQDPLKPLSHQDPLKPLSHQDQPLNQQDPLKPLSHQDPLKPLNQQDPLKPLSHQDPLKPLSHQDPLKPLSTEVHDSGVKTPSSEQESFTQPDPVDVLNVSVSEDLRKTIPKNGAYWNRLLYLALSILDQGKLALRGDWSNCRETNGERLQTNVDDLASYPVLLQDFLQGMNCSASPVLIDQPSKCSSGPEDGNDQTFLLFAIKTTPGNFEGRQAVRDTWGKEKVYRGGLRVRTVFLLGTPPPDAIDLSTLVSLEAKHFGDILQWDFQESFFNLTLKGNSFLQWTLTNCPQASFIFSGDDDVFVNTPAMLRFLNSLQASHASHLYVGHVIRTASPHRDPNNKYYIPMSFYDGPYPAYAGGGGFVVSGELLKSLYYVSRFIPFFPIDDVYTGMCAQALGVYPEAHPGFQTFDVKEQDRGNLCVHKGLIMIHQRSPTQMKKLWKGINSPLLTC